MRHIAQYNETISFDHQSTYDATASWGPEISKYKKNQKWMCNYFSEKKKNSETASIKETTHLPTHHIK